jgi:MFS superfamily sulfate permease-like transporter
LKRYFENGRQMTLLNGISMFAGFLIDFISMPVIAGFTSAACITIASGQVKSLLGLSIDNSKKYILFTV